MVTYRLFVGRCRDGNGNCSGTNQIDGDRMRKIQKIDKRGEA